MEETFPPKSNLDKISDNLESSQEVNKALVKSIVANKCPKCHNNLEKNKRE